MTEARMDMKCAPGAVIERGEAVQVSEEGVTVRGLDRPGMVTPPLRAVCGDEIGAGDTVYYALFPDGEGIIIARREA